MMGYSPGWEGFYVIGEKTANGYPVQIYFRKRPLWLHRWMMRVCLGIIWVDEAREG